MNKIKCVNLFTYAVVPLFRRHTLFANARLEILPGGAGTEMSVKTV
jgi:hypothetical protein